MKNSEKIFYEQKAEIEQLTAKYRNLENNYEYDHELYRQYELENQKLKEENERLTEENGYLDCCAKQFLADYRKCEIERAELQKQVDELKEQLKSVQSACQSKNSKIKNLKAENEALQNELNAQNGKPHYRYVVWNTKQNKRQFQSICELTESGAYTKLFQKIGWDSAKYRFEVRRIKVESVDVE